MRRRDLSVPGRAALAAWIGSAVEYYDFFIYGTAAALVFGRVFFPADDPVLGTLTALATFGVGYVARPLGAVLLGHLGDRHGRGKVLTFTLLLMGVSTFLIGVLPTYAQAGPLAPALLVVLRLLQGLSVAGEQAGASSMTIEHAPPARRAFYASFTSSGTTAGSITATLVFLPVAALPEQALLAWGWRVPFLLSVVVVAVGLWIRRAVPETPAFLQQEDAGGMTRLPLAELCTSHISALLRVICASLVSAVSTIFGVYALAYAVDVAGLPRAMMLAMLLAAGVVALAAVPVWASLADRVGRKRVFICGTLGCAALIWPYLWAVGRAAPVLVWTFGLLLSGVVYSAVNAVWPAFYGEMFSTRVRLSGLAIGTQIGFAFGGLAPAICAAIARDGEGGWAPAAALVTAVCMVSAIAAAIAQETRAVPIGDLGRRG